MKNGEIYSLFAELLAYPQPGLSGSVTRLQHLLMVHHPDSAGEIFLFEDYVKRTPLPRLEEIYSGLFELDPSLHPYAAYQLFGESYKRSLFMVGLKEGYRQIGLDTGSELPDHFVFLLRYIAASNDEEGVSELVHLAFLPALEKILKRTSPGDDGECNRDDTQKDPLPGCGAPSSDSVGCQLVGEEGGGDVRKEEKEESPQMAAGRKAYLRVLSALWWVLAERIRAPHSVKGQDVRGSVASFEV